MSTGNYNWTEFYFEFAKKLLEFKENRTELINKIIETFKRIDMKMPTLEKDNNIVDIDPFTIFGLFNKSSMKDENRKKIISGIKEIFNLKNNVPDKFDSIPVLNNINATYYSFIEDRDEKAIDNLWELFSHALEYEKSPTEEILNKLKKYFDLAIDAKYNGNSKITMGLFWIAPKIFLNLDSRNEWYIYESGKIPKSIVETLPEVDKKISSNKYFEILEKVKEYLDNSSIGINNFKDLSFDAWLYSNEVNKRKKEQAKEKGDGLADSDVETISYWTFSPGENAKKWDDFYEKGIMGIPWEELGDLREYSSKDEMVEFLKDYHNTNYTYKNFALAAWEFANEMKVGDVIFVKTGRNKLLGKGIVKSDYYNDLEYEEYPNQREVDWINNVDIDIKENFATKTLTNISPYTEFIKSLNDYFVEETPIIEMKYPEYSKEKFLEEVYINEKDYNTLVQVLKKKKNIILQGAPGVGKTFIAKRLAYSLLGEKNQEKVKVVQFHQSYSYEDFIEGFRPSSDGKGFEIKKGSFYLFCKEASEDLDKDYYFIIDEINRGNLSKIFGELFMLIENDKRGNELQLLYSDEKFKVPANVYIIGMMNTADRSLALLDYALRRRFAFFDIKPGFITDGFIKYKNTLGSSVFEKVINVIEEINKEIEEDETLGKGFCIGHSYFCNVENVENELPDIIDFEILPLLEEYWYDDKAKVDRWAEKLRREIK